MCIRDRRNTRPVSCTGRDTFCRGMTPAQKFFLNGLQSMKIILRNTRCLLYTSADSTYSVELVSPVCVYEDIGTIQEIVRALRRNSALASSFTPKASEMFCQTIRRVCLPA